MEERVDRLSARTGFLATAGLIALAASLVALVVSMQAGDQAASRDDFLELREMTAELKGELRRTSDTARLSEDSADTVRLNLDQVQEDLGAIERRQRRLAAAGQELSREVDSVRDGVRELRSASESAVAGVPATGGQASHSQPVSNGTG